MFPVFGELGCSEYWWRWLPDTFPEVWASIDDAPEMALILTRLGFDWDEVVAPAAVVKDRASDYLRWRTPESAFGAILTLIETVPEASILLCDNYREKYSTEAVAEKLLEFLGRGPAPEQQHIEPVYLGRPQSV